MPPRCPPPAPRATLQNADVSLPRRRYGRWGRGSGDGVAFLRLTKQTAGSTPSHRRGGRRWRRSADGPVSKCDLLADEGGTAVGVCGDGSVTGDPGLQHHLVAVRSVVVPAVEVEARIDLTCPLATRAPGAVSRHQERQQLLAQAFAVQLLFRAPLVLTVHARSDVDVFRHPCPCFRPHGRVVYCPAGKPYVQEETRKPQPRCPSPFLDQGDPPLHATVALRSVDGGELATDAVLSQQVSKRVVDEFRPVVCAEGSRLPVLLPQRLDDRQEDAEGVGDGVGGFVLQEDRPPQVGVAVYDEEAINQPSGRGRHSTGEITVKKLKRPGRPPRCGPRNTPTNSLRRHAFGAMYERSRQLYSNLFRSLAQVALMRVTEASVYIIEVMDVEAPGRRTAATMAGETMVLETVVAGMPGFRQTAGEPLWATLVACT